ncbi:cytochrome B [Rhodoferax koreense]|uniref:Cytochrome B n=1 Tax=Rhodoferax koreensis TaxID=1842727 RepID=A0A1P8JWL9_9BURK|nr:cytochrome b [Rhodoferax koreense]APW38160.1 cytochrome B [Rhodoferax koreense]
MSVRHDTDRYSRLSISLHWLMLLLIAAVYACMEFKGIFPRGSAGREGIQTWHFMLGLAVLALALVRIVVAVVSRTPPIVPQPPKWQSRTALLMKLALYAFMVATPVLGWLVLSAKGVSIPFFGLQLPALIGADKATASGIKEIHETLATIGYFLIGGHAAAALFHHYVVRDNTLLRMLGGHRRVEA